MGADVLTPVSTYVLGGLTHHVVIGDPPAVRRRRGRPCWLKVGWHCWQHASGWQVHHCGHPTANWPYSGVRPDGSLLHLPNGRAFRHLADAQAAVELEQASTGGAA